MLSAVRLLARQSSHLRQWGWLSQARFIQKGEDTPVSATAPSVGTATATGPPAATALPATATVPPAVTTGPPPAEPDPSPTDPAPPPISSAQPPDPSPQSPDPTLHPPHPTSQPPSDPTSPEEAVSADQVATTFHAIRRVFSSCSTMDELLAVAGRRELLRTEALLWLSAVAHRAAEERVPAARVTTHPCYRSVTEQLRSGNTDRQPLHRLLTPARALTELGVPPDDPLLASLITDLVWNLRKMTMKQLVQCFRLSQSSAQPSKHTSQLRSLSLEAIQRRWVEITSADEVVSLMKHSAQLPSDFVRRLEDRALDAAGTTSAGEASRLLATLAAQRRRPPPLLRALCFHAARQPEPMAYKDAVRTLFALQKLNFPDQMLLEKLGRDLVTQTPAVERVNVISSALTAAGQLRWRNTEFLEAAAAWYQTHLDSLRPQDVVSLVITLATVNYSPTNADKLIPALLSRCGRAQLPRPQVWLDLVWSLSVLGRSSPDQLRSVLEPEFCRRLQQDAPHLGSRLKLSNLEAYARLRDGYQGPAVSFSGEPAAPPRSHESDALRKSVLEALVNLAPPPRYLHVPTTPAAGCAVDAEFVVNDEGSPAPCERYGSALPGAERTGETPPPGIHRVALCTWTYRDLTLDSVELTGFSQMTLALLELSGYKVLEVAHSELRPQDSQVVRAKLIRQKIRDLVAR